ncbi:MAG: alpha-L-fucosidase [Verrucomicrobia bacterium]|nr:alpha-L-fucosidase [Verrucomicrobiota bacterium]
MKTILSPWLPVLTGLMLLPAAAPSAPADFRHESPAERDARMAWFREARFGMFIHWGVYAVPAGEWKGKTHYGEWFMEETKMPVSEYEAFARQFNPVRFDAREWVRIARNAGMKYMVITSKHHDGFGLWRSALTDWCITGTPFPRDPLKELAQACRDAGLKLCFYHSIMDWHHPDWGTRRKWNDRAPATPPVMDRYVAFMKGQLKELITGYGPLGILWFDGEWESPWTHERGVDLYNYVRSLQPDILVNNRVGKGRAGMAGMDRGRGVGDYGTPEQEIPATGFGPGVDWESCMTMNNHWGYNRHDQHWKSTTVLIRNLIDCASKGGNYLLNVGPTAEGVFPGPSIERLAAMGAWMQTHGESIYGTTASPFKKLAFGRCTQKPGKLYLHVFDWPADGRLVVPIANRVRRAHLLANRASPLQGESTAQGYTLSVPPTAPDVHAAVVALEIDGQPEVLSTAIAQAPDGTLVLNAADAELVGRTLRLETKADGIPNIGYWTDAHDSVQWAVRLTRTGTYKVEMTSACEPGSAGSECVLTVGNRDGSVTIVATGGWGDFQTRPAGTLTLDQTGPTTVTLKAKTKPGMAVVNLRRITFTPAD